MLQDLPESDKPARNVVFVDAGHVGTQVAACSFHKGKLTMISSAFCDVGGRLFDEAIANQLVSDFATRYVMFGAGFWENKTNKKQLKDFFLQEDI